MSKLKKVLSKNLMNAIGWRTNRKIIVIESDDWGMIRMASKAAQDTLRQTGYSIAECPYNLNDGIESDSDVRALAEVLLSIKDSNGNHCKFTLNNVVANPDFDKIRDANFETYYFEPFTKTLQKHRDSQNVMSLYKEGIAKNIFQPQLHGREHINLRLWLKRLQEGDVKALDAFQQNMYTVHKSGKISGRRDNLDAFGNSTISGTYFDYVEILKDAQQIFKETWGFKSKSFIAPCYTWHPLVEKVLRDEGITYIQGTHVQRIPIDNDSYQIKKKYHYTGQKNNWDQYYLIRNCFFEPTEFGSNNTVEKTLQDVKLAFAYKKPAIISSHRVNYMGTLNPDNRSENLSLLKRLLQEIVKKWPDVEFMSTDELGDLITN
jgi:hypothetical protein